MKPIQKLRERDGFSYPLLCCVILGILLIATGVFEFLRIQMIASGVRDALQSAVVETSIDNWDELYNGLREGYSGGYELYGDSWGENISNGDVYGNLSSLLGLKKEGSKYVKYAGDEIEFALYGLSTSIDNVPFAPGSTSQTFRATSTITMEVPLSLTWRFLPPMVVELRVRSGYTPKF